jgi:hypothetical protein
MDGTYWIGRQAAAGAMARRASSAKIRLIHYELAGRYGVKAASCLPFMLPGSAPAGRETRAVLHLPVPPSLDATATGATGR